jgi:hypothetical protein
MLVDNKDKTVVTESDIDKAVRDAMERSTAFTTARADLSPR